MRLLFKKLTNSRSNGEDLKHDEFFNQLRQKEYNRLDKENQVYLDYTGGNLYANSQIEQHHELLKKFTFGNPHSTNPTSKLASKLVEEARNKIIQFFNAEDYFCVFTPNASGALKIIGECYPFDKDGHFLLLADNHNSVNGIREYCKSSGGSFEYSPMNIEDLSVSATSLEKNLKAVKNKNKLFAFPAQSNVSGVKHDLGWISSAQELGWDVLLDAAAFVPTSTLDLKKYAPNYVSISFYKIFGYPTGLGCLLIRKDSFEKLNKKWFAGGTVSLAAVKAPFHFLIDNHERFENGTINYLDIPALTIGLDFIDSIGMKKINERVEALMDYLHSNLRIMQHSNGENQLDIFGHPNRENMGGNLIMCFKNPDGSKIGFEKIEELANKDNISIRSGCFCNPGLDETNNCLSSEELTKYFENRESGDYWEMIRYINKMRGATRVSVGIATTKNDLDKFLAFVKNLQDKPIASTV